MSMTNKFLKFRASNRRIQDKRTKFLAVFFILSKSCGKSRIRLNPHPDGIEKSTIIASASMKLILSMLKIKSSPILAR
jgi:hypothetical protein